METYNFWQLINKYKIEIPIIQREYAQGRIEDKVNTIRSEFVQSIINEISNTEKSSMHLGFVYGKLFGKTKQEEIKRNKEAIANVLSSVKSYAKHLNLNIDSNVKEMEEAKDNYVPSFIPLDGQQRLTTLYLFHWYLAQFTNEDSCKNSMQTLSRFQYKSRKNAEAFCDFLTNKNLQNVVLDTTFCISEILKTNTYFFKIWEKDSTVQGMLKMLDEIEKQISSLGNKTALFHSLTDSLPFDFLDLNELNQTDELYVKMNARGKHLSGFENFKARLIKYVNESESLKNNLVQKEWQKKLDKTWLDMFWQANDVDANIDNIIYQAFRKINNYIYIANNDKADENFVRIIREDKYFSFKELVEKKFFTSESLNFVFNSLDQLSNTKHVRLYADELNSLFPNHFASYNNLSQFFIKIEQGEKGKNKTTTMPSEVYHFAFLLYLNTPDIKTKDEDLKLFKIWMRICRNLIFNTYVQNPKEYILSIKSIYKLSKNITEIDEYIINQKNEVSFFDNDQRKQEALKLKLIQDENAWARPIFLFENHSYFIGDIGFVFQFSEDQDGGYSLVKFKQYSSILSKLYSQEILQRADRIFYRALLCKGDYLPHISGNNYTFCLPTNGSLRIRKDNWRKYFSSEKIKFLKELIDEDINNETTVLEDLTTVIKNFNKDSWEKFIIECPETINYSFEGVGHIWYDSPEEVLLLKTSKKYGRNVELRSYNYYQTNDIANIKNSFFDEVSYFENTPVSTYSYDYPCVLFIKEKFKDQALHLEITYKSSVYYIQFAEASANKIKSTKIKNVFSTWEIHENRFFQEVKTVKELKVLLNQTLDSLSQLNNKL